MRAIDFHVHVPQEPGLPPLWYEEGTQRYFRLDRLPRSMEEMVSKYEDLDIKAVIFSVDHETASGERPSSNDWVATIVQKYPERFIGFATVDPWKGKVALQELERAVRELGLKGLKLHPALQAFFPNDRRFYPLWEKCVELDLPVILHTGITGVGAGLPGGGGIKLKYVAPIPSVDDVAADFPQLTLIMAHPAWPWQEEQLALCLHKANVYMDLSGWSPKYFPDSLVRYANSLLQDKMLFGTDYPWIQPDRWLRDFDNLPLSDGVKSKILLENAQRVLKL